MSSLISTLQRRRRKKKEEGLAEDILRAEDFFALTPRVVVGFTAYTPQEVDDDEDDL